MLNLNKKTAVILLSDGSPDNMDSIDLFLFNVFNDATVTPLIQPFRFLWAKCKTYQKIASIKGLFSQISDRTALSNAIVAQAYALEKELSYSGDYKVVIATKYAQPSIKDACQEVRKYDPDQLILLPLYPQFSAANAGSLIEKILNRMRLERGANEKEMAIKLTNSYPQVNSFILSHSLLIQKTIRPYIDKIERLHFLFVAPGIPERFINQGDPYISQLKISVEAVMESVRTTLKINQDQLEYQLCFQPKMAVADFMKPTLEQKMKRAILQDKIPVIVPIASTCDSIETKLDLAIKYRDIARKFGLSHYLLVPNLNYDGNYIRALVEICQEIDASDKFLLSSENTLK